MQQLGKDQVQRGHAVTVFLEREECDVYVIVIYVFQIQE